MGTKKNYFSAFAFALKMFAFSRKNSAFPPVTFARKSIEMEAVFEIVPYIPRSLFTT